jgi:hypothetical protein
LVWTLSHCYYLVKGKISPNPNPNRKKDVASLVIKDRWQCVQVIIFPLNQDDYFRTADFLYNNIYNIYNNKANTAQYSFSYAWVLQITTMIIIYCCYIILWYLTRELCITYLVRYSIQVNLISVILQLLLFHIFDMYYHDPSEFLFEYSVCVYSDVNVNVSRSNAQDSTATITTCTYSRHHERTSGEWSPSLLLYIVLFSICRWSIASGWCDVMCLYIFLQFIWRKLFWPTLVAVD